jgi:hypothetical protein
VNIGCPHSLLYMRVKENTASFPANHPSHSPAHHSVFWHNHGYETPDKMETSPIESLCVITSQKKRESRTFFLRE